MRMGETTYVPVETSGEPPIHPSLPQRPAFEVAPVNSPSRLSMPSAHVATQPAPVQEGIKMASNHDVVANRRAIRMANMSAAELLKAELAGRASVQITPPSTNVNIVVPQVPVTASDVPVEPPSLPLPSLGHPVSYEDYAFMEVLPGLGGPRTTVTAGKEFPSATSSVEIPSTTPPSSAVPVKNSDDAYEPATTDPDADGEGSEVMDTDTSVNGDAEDSQEAVEARGTKRKLEGVEAEESSVIEDEAAPDASDAPATRKVNPDGTVEQEDTIKCVVSNVDDLAALT